MDNFKFNFFLQGQFESLRLSNLLFAIIARKFRGNHLNSKQQVTVSFKAIINRELLNAFC